MSHLCKDLEGLKFFFDSIEDQYMGSLDKLKDNIEKTLMVSYDKSQQELKKMQNVLEADSKLQEIENLY